MASELIDLLERDEKVRKRISKLVVAEILLDPELKLLMVEKSLQALATKGDLRETEERLRSEIRDVEDKLRTEFKSEIAASEERLKSYVDVKFEALNKRIDDLFKVTASTLIAIVVGMVGLFVSRAVL